MSHDEILNFHDLLLVLVGYLLVEAADAILELVLVQVLRRVVVARAELLVLNGGLEHPMVVCPLVGYRFMLLQHMKVVLVKSHVVLRMNDRTLRCKLSSARGRKCLLLFEHLLLCQLVALCEDMQRVVDAELGAGGR